MSTVEQERRKAFASLLSSGRYSDMRIICPNKNFNVHMSVLCSQSDYFDKCMSSEFKETESRSIELEDDPRLVCIVLQYLYEGTYEPETHIATLEAYGKMVLNVEIYAMADRMQILPLKSLIMDQIKSLDTKDPDFSAAIKQVFRVTLPGDGLRHKMVDSAYMSAKTLFAANQPDARRLLDEIPELCKELFLQHALQDEPFYYDYCPAKKCNSGYSHFHRVSRR